MFHQSACSGHYCHRSPQSRVTGVSQSDRRVRSSHHLSDEPRTLVPRYPGQFSSMAIESKRAKRWFKRLSESRHMLWLLGTLSFLETIIIPVPIEVVLIPLMAANMHRIWMLATVTTVGCLLASIVGYGVGIALYGSVGVWFIETMGMEGAYESFQGLFDEYGFVAILTLGVLPIPFQVAMITAGLSGYPIYLFVLAALIARGARYYGLAWLVTRFGERMEDLWRRHALVTSLIAAATILSVSLAMQWLAGKVM